MAGVSKLVDTESSQFFLNPNDSRSTARRWTISLLALFAICVGVVAPSPASAQVNVTTWHNDIGRTGQNLNETTLNTTNVTSALFGKIFAQPVDGQIYAQPLYLSGITVNGATHNVVFVATEHDSVYAFDADTNGGTNSAPLWQISMLSTAHGAAPGATTVSAEYVGSDINPEVGITGTPVIDPATNTLYVVSKSLENGAYPQRLHALDVTTGAEKFGGPVLITATVAGTGNGSVNGTLTFDSLWENQRPGLLLLNGIVYVGFAAHGDNGPWHGWILGYNAATLKQTGAYCSSPNGTGAGFWMSGEGLAADQLTPATKPFGRMFVPTGNGDYNASAPYTNAMDFGDSHLNLDLTNGNPTITDEFTTNQQAHLDSEDGDVGSGGMMVVPTQTTGSYPHLAVQVGKAGTLFLINRDNMGGYNLNADQMVQAQLYATPNGAWSTTAYWNGNVYLWGRYDKLRSFKLANGLLSTTPTLSNESYDFPGSTPSISANGTSQGIVWSLNTSGFGTSGATVLQAHDASNVSTTLYSSTTNAARDAGGVGVKFQVPTVTNGKVYVGTATELDVYGLLSGATQTNAPSFSPGAESYTGTLNVTISDTTSGAAIYYTTDGSAATTSSTLYTAPIPVNTTETIRAIASANGLLVSAQSSATYTNNSQAASVTFSLPTGTYGSTQSVTLSDSTTGAAIHYTLDGSTPTASSTVYTGAITVASSETISAIATGTGLANSPVISQTYVINSATSGVAFGNGFSAAASVMHFNGSTQLNDTRLQLTDGGAGEQGTAWYITPVNIQSFTTDFTFQLSNPVSNGITFAIQNSPQYIYALGGNGYVLGYAPIPNSIAIKFDLYNSAGEGPDSTGLYVNGANPTVPSINLTGTGIDLHSDDTMAVHLVYNGTTLTMSITDIVTAAVFSTSWTVNIPTTIGSNTAYVGFTGSTGAYTASQKILTWSFSSGTTSAPTTVATPTFSVAAGTYAAAQAVTLADATSGAKIYYTTNGTTPTSSSTLYSGAITVSASETLEAIAISGSTSSSVASAAYVIQGTPATPTFSPGNGTYTTTQTVTISDTSTATGAVIHYTTDGSTPTVSSPKYSGPIAVTATETLKAVADFSTTNVGAVASATYTIQAVAATPVLSLATGTYYGAQTLTMTDSTTGATIYYTTDGTTPTKSSTAYTGPITISKTETIKATAASSTTSASPVATATYTISSVAVTAPVISPGTGTYPVQQNVAITDSTSGTKIYYTTDGTTPTAASTLYAGLILVKNPGTISAIAVSSAGTSAVSAATYTLTCVAPTVSPAAGTYTSAQTITITRAYPDDNLYYTIDGTTPTVNSTKYTAPFTVSTTTTVKVLAQKTGFNAAPIVTQTYTITSGTTAPIINYGSGFTAASFNLYGATIANGALTLTDGVAGEGHVAWYATPVNVQKFTSDFTFKDTAASADGFTFAIQNASAGIWAVGGNASSLGYAGIPNSIAVKFDLYNNAGEGSDSTGFYVDGAAPTVPAVDMTSSGVNLHSGDTMHAHITYDGSIMTLLLTDTVTNASFTTSKSVNIPTTVGSNTAYVGFTGGTGGLTAVQNVLTWTYTVN